MFGVGVASIGTAKKRGLEAAALIQPLVAPSASAPASRPARSPAAVSVRWATCAVRARGPSTLEPPRPPCYRCAQQQRWRKDGDSSRTDEGADGSVPASWIGHG